MPWKFPFQKRKIEKKILLALTTNIELYCFFFVNWSTWPYFCCFYKQITININSRICMLDYLWTDGYLHVRVPNINIPTIYLCFLFNLCRFFLCSFNSSIHIFLLLMVFFHPDSSLFIGIREVRFARPSDSDVKSINIRTHARPRFFFSMC